MNRKYTVVHLLLVALIASGLTVVAEKVLSPEKAVAQQPANPLEGLTLFAGPRRDTEKDESFIFVNYLTGDVWVYRDRNFKDHYRIGKMGEPFTLMEHK